jgi:tetratricopeptide (TPR) repeat protein
LRATFGADVLRFEREGRWKYLHKVNAELYDLMRDPGESRNLADLEPEVLARLRDRLRTRLESANAPAGAALTIDPQRRAELMALGYVASETGHAIEDELSTLDLAGPDPMDMLTDIKRFTEGWTHVQELHRYEDGERIFADLLERHPKSTPVLRGLATARLGRGRVEEAIPLLRQVVEREPCAQGSRLTLFHLLGARGNRVEQRALLEEGVARCPEILSFQNDLAYLLATCPDEAVRDGPKAVRMARRIVEESDARDPAYLDTLAVAYAETGDFERAVGTGRRALEVARAQEAQPEVIDALEEHQEAIELGRPIRDP